MAARAVAGGNAVEIIGRDAAKAKALAGALGGGATVGTAGTAPAGDIVILAVPYASAAPVVAQYGDALAGKVIVDITNPFNPELHRACHPRRQFRRAGDRQGRRRRRTCREGVQHPLRDVLAAGSAEGRPLDVFIAGDDAQAKAQRVSVHLEPRTAPAGRRAAAHGAGTGERGPAGAGPHDPLVKHTNFALGVTILG